MESRASEAILVGQAGGGYLLFNPSTKRYITRRDVRFDDNNFPLLRRVLSAYMSLIISPRRAVIEALSGPRTGD